MARESDLLTLLSEMKGLYPKKEYEELASKYGNPHYLLGRMKGEIVEIVEKYIIKKTCFEKLASKLERKRPEEMEKILKEEGVKEADLKEMVAFFLGYFRIK